MVDEVVVCQQAVYKLLRTVRKSRLTCIPSHVCSDRTTEVQILGKVEIIQEVQRMVCNEVQPA